MKKKPIKPVVVKPEATEKPHPVAAQPPEAPAAQNSLSSSQDDGEKTKTKKTVLVISIAASVVLIGIILTGVLLLKQPDNDKMEASNDATFEVSREDSDTTVQQSNDASLEVSREDTDTTVQQFPTPNQMTSEEEQQGQYAASNKEEIAYDLYLQTDKNHIVDGETVDFWVDVTNNGTRTFKIIRAFNGDDFDPVQYDCDETVAPGETVRIGLQKKVRRSMHIFFQIKVYYDEEEQWWEFTDVMYFDESGKKYYPRDADTAGVLCEAYLEPEEVYVKSGEEVTYTIHVKNLSDVAFEKISIINDATYAEIEASYDARILPGQEKEFTVYDIQEIAEGYGQCSVYLIWIKTETGKEFGVYTNIVSAWLED